jgi:hypothetical protein
VGEGLEQEVTMRASSVFRAVVFTAAFGSVMVGVPPPALAHVDVDIGIFAGDLQPYGRWVPNHEYGNVWVPRVHRDWRPYTMGRWVWTDDYGWLWVSDEPFGWAVYHYGRWAFDPYYGWIWVPGRQWAPAWVSFRRGGGYVGWAPLPPRARWDARLGFRGGAFDFDAYVRPQHYCFVEERRFLDDRIHRRAVPAPRNATIVNNTRNVTNITVINQRVVNRSVQVAEVERATGHAVPRSRVFRADSARHAGRVHDRDVRIYKPVDDDREGPAPPRKDQPGRDRGRDQNDADGDHGRGRGHPPDGGDGVDHGRGRGHANRGEVNPSGHAAHLNGGSEQPRGVPAPDRQRARARGRARVEERPPQIGRERAEARGRARAEEGPAAIGRDREARNRAARETRANRRHDGNDGAIAGTRGLRAQGRASRGDREAAGRDPDRGRGHRGRRDRPAEDDTNP